jgi:ZIP family zinc transporter
MPGWLIAGLYGLLSATGLLVGALAGWSLTMRHRTIACITAVGVGLLTAVASLYLISSALESVTPTMVALGALLGALGFSSLNLALDRWDAGNRKRCGECVSQPTEAGKPGSGLAIAFGSLLDAIPEALIIGATVATVGGGLPPVALVGAFALGNVAEGLTSTAGLRTAGRGRRYVLLLWAGVALVTAASSVLGYALFTGGGVGQGWLESIAAGALLALVVETMAPEAVHGQPRFSGLLAMVGFAGLLLALAS